MNTIKLNTTEFEVEAFNKNTYFTGTTIMSNANCSIKLIDVSALSALIPLTITSIQIKHNNDVIYNLSDIEAKIDSTVDYLNNDHITTTINLTINMEEETEPNT